MIHRPPESTKRVSLGFVSLARIAAQDDGALNPTAVTRPVETIASEDALTVRPHPAMNDSSAQR